jgi:nucleolar pre-ribosomal-associated protein 1
MQLTSARANEATAWVKILENILSVVDSKRLETSTGGEWRSALCRNLLLLVPHNETGISFLSLNCFESDSVCIPASTMTFLASMATVALRLSLQPGPTVPHLSLLVDRLLCTLKRFEKEMSLPVSYSKTHYGVQPHTSLHGAVGLFDTPSSHDPVKQWGEGVEALWRITMTLENKIPAWDALTCRLLLWRSIAGEDGSSVGEWARREVVRNLRM